MLRVELPIQDTPLRYHPDRSFCANTEAYQISGYDCTALCKRWLAFSRERGVQRSSSFSVSVAPALSPLWVIAVRTQDSTLPRRIARAEFLSI